ncbi:hypothetical protein ACFRFH_11920 [Leifsonia sp. NPDC056824]
MATLVFGRNGSWFFAEEHVLFNRTMRRLDAIAAEEDVLPEEVPC